MLSDVHDERICNAIEQVWRSVLNIREFTRGFFFFQQVLLPHEYKDVFANEGKRGNTVPRLTRQQFDAKVSELFSEVENVRPFVGETIWTMYWVYRAFAIRQALKVQDGLVKGKLHEWDKDFEGRPDAAIQQLIRAAFTEQELSQFGFNNSGGPINRIGTTTAIMTALEGKILNAMNDWIFKREFDTMKPEVKQALQSVIIQVQRDMNVGGDIAGRDILDKPRR